jgi:hypothetical protein
VLLANQEICVVITCSPCIDCYWKLYRQPENQKENTKVFVNIYELSADSDIVAIFAFFTFIA